MKETPHIQVWNNCLQIIKDVIPAASFKTWFEPIKAVSLEGATFTIEVPSEFFREYLEEHFIDFISKALKREIGSNARLLYKVRVADSVITYPPQSSHELKNKSIPFPQKEGSIPNPFIIPGPESVKVPSRSKRM